MTLKRLRALTAAAILGTGALIFGLAGCTGYTESSGDVLNVWESYNNEEHRVFDEMARQPFEAWYRQKTGKPIRIVLGRVPFDGLLPKLKTACQTRTTPDICRVDVAHVVQLAYGKAIVPLDTLQAFGGGAPEKLRGEYVPAAYDSCLLELKQPGGQWVKHLYGLPDQTNCLCLFYNKRLFRENADRLRKAGLDPEAPPATWEQFKAYARALTLPAVSQFGFAMDNSLWWTLPYLNSWGATFLGRDGAGNLVCTLTEKAAVEAFKYKVGLYRERFQVDGVETSAEAGAWIPGAVDPTQGFANSNYAMIFSGPWNLENLKLAKGVELGVGLVPQGPKGGVSTTGGSNLVVFRHCKNQEAAFEFLRFVTSAEFQLKWASRLGQIPVRADVMDKVDLKDRPELKVFYKQMLSAQARPAVPGYDRLEELVNPELELGLKGQRTPEEALTAAAKIVQQQVLSAVNEL
ncbi:MAG: extracellular solute-binding protein [Candidatus Wallbacteria bacterium]|nr:extracellular solute-binding protein [Candidatus Wallbacteria bacterium]